MSEQGPGSRFQDPTPPRHDSAGGHVAGAFGPQGGYNFQQPGAAPYGDADPYSPGDKPMQPARNNEMNDFFFWAAMCIVIGSLLGGTCLFFSMKAVEFLQLTYLMVFGAALAIMDTPVLKSIKFVGMSKLYIGKHFSLITRVTGKGVVLIFMGSALFMTIWDTLESGFMRFLAALLCLFPVCIGFTAVVVGFFKSTRLDKARKQMQHIVDHEGLHQFARHEGGLSMEAFNDLCQTHSGIKFERLDLQLIFNALSSNPAWRAQVAASTQPRQGYGYAGEAPLLPKEDVVAWAKGGFVFL